jgi:hypothetical protein
VRPHLLTDIVLTDLRTKRRAGCASSPTLAFAAALTRFIEFARI